MSTTDDLLAQYSAGMGGAAAAPIAPTAPAGPAMSSTDALLQAFNGGAPAVAAPSPVLGGYAAGHASLVEEDPQRQTTAMEKILNVLSIPNNAMAGAAQALIEGRNPLEGVPEGLRRHTTFGKVLSDQGVNGPLAGMLGFGLDVALDPTTYVGLGGLTKAGEAAKLATYGMKSAMLAGDAAEAARLATQVGRTGRFGATMAERARAGQAALVTFAGHSVVPRSMSERVFQEGQKVGSLAANSPLGQSAQAMFKTLANRVEEPLRAAAFASRAKAYSVTRRTVEQFLTPAQKEVAALAKAAGVDVSVANAMLAEATQLAKSPVDILSALRIAKARYGVPGLADAPLARAVNAINAANAFAIASERAAGLKISELVGSQNYLKRAITSEGLDAIRKSTPSFRGLTSKEFAVDFGAQIQRDEQLRDLTIREINDLGRQGKLEITGGIPVREFFHEDPFVATSRRLNESADAIASREFLTGAGHVYGVPAAQAPAGWRTLRGALPEQMGWKKIQQIKGKKVVARDLAFEPEVANLLESNYERMVTPQFLRPFLNTFDQLQSGFKAWTLSIWPSYHSRNALSDAWMVTAIPGGMPLWRLPQRVTQSIKALRSATGDVRLGNHTYAWDELRRLAESVGVTDMGVGRDVEEMIRQPLLRDKLGALDVLSKNRFIDLGMAAGRARENAGRMAYFIERLARGETPAMASLEVKKRLFDYGELTGFEKQVLRRVFPFYSWARHNIPLQIESIAHRPGYGATYQKLREEVGVSFGERNPSAGASPLPDFLARGMPIPVGHSQSGSPRFLRTQNIIPTGDVQQVFQPAQTVIDQMTPLLKSPAETAYNVDLFRQQPLETYPGETTRYLGLPVRKRAAPLLDLFRPIPEASRLLGPGQPGLTPSGTGERLANYLISRTYEVDPMQQVERQSRNVQSTLRDYHYRLRRAVQRGDAANAEVLQRNITELYSHPESARVGR